MMKLFLLSFMFILISCGSDGPETKIPNADNPAENFVGLAQRWITTDLPIKIRIDTDYEFNPEMISAIENSLNRYNEVFSQDVFELEIASTPYFPTSVEYLDDYISSIVFTQPWLSNQHENSLAITSYARIENRIIKSDIIFNTEHFSFSYSPQPGNIDLESTLTHELGHILGLQHIDPAMGVSCLDTSIDRDDYSCSIMNPNLGFNQVHRRLSQRDIISLLDLYPELL